jgi:hypothetical protein
VVVGGGGCVGGVGRGVVMHYGGGLVGWVFWMGVGEGGITCIVVGGIVVGVVLGVRGVRLPSAALIVPTPSFCPARYSFHESVRFHWGCLRPSCHPYRLAVVCGVQPSGIPPTYYGIPVLIGKYYTGFFLCVCG